MPLFSICIPAYNRAEVLPELLDSIFEQAFEDFEIVICEDNSPQRYEIHKIVSQYMSLYPSIINYIENPVNLGYDGNLRNLIEKSRGEYCLFMGNDDLMCEGALTKLARVVNEYSQIGVVLRTYASFDANPHDIVETFRYFDKELFFPAGEKTISTLYRRSVVIPGMVIHRQAAQRIATNRFDGTLLYQLYLVGMILSEKNAVYLPDVIVLYRLGGQPDFGNSKSEQGKFKPKEQTPESSVHFMRGMLDIAAFIEHEKNLNIFRPIRKDIANYSYPILAIQANKSIVTYFNYGWSLAKLGFARHPLFIFWFFSILLLGTKRLNRVILWVKNKLGYTPRLGTVYRGDKQ